MRRALKNSPVKGPWMPSYDTQHIRGDRKRYGFVPGTQSTRSQKRRLRNRVRHLIDSPDPVVISVGDRVIRAVCAEPDPEFSALHLFNAALTASEDTGEAWIVCMNYIMDKFDALEKPVEEDTHAVAEETDKGSEGGSFFSRLLRAVATRTLRKSHEKAAERNVDQSTSAGNPSLETHTASSGGPQSD